jgi:predicted transcriptional regulator
LTTIYSLEFEKLKSENRTKSRARGRILTYILVAARTGVSKKRVAVRLRLNEKIASRYLASLAEARLVQPSESNPSDNVYYTTGSGLRFVKAYQNLRRMSDKNPTRSQSSQFQQDYHTCTNCETHPQYPEIHPVTLHKAGVCLLCHAKS